MDVFRIRTDVAEGPSRIVAGAENNATVKRSLADAG
jgi:hypothetical protein